ncbi:hypothetical protein ACFY93_08260 [Streptomyces sp. NPDC008313]|uniref:hypothetical protein n=1 Tax=Streptomyces sp. NPDC008313 TaxID=3364826 RepID=UPI0036F055BE
MGKPGSDRTTHTGGADALAWEMLAELTGCLEPPWPGGAPAPHTDGAERRPHDARGPVDTVSAAREGDEQ